MSLSQDGRLLAAKTSVRDVRVWDLDSGEAVFSILRTKMWFTSVALSADGARLAVGGTRGAAKVWDIANGAEIVSVGGPDGGRRTRLRRVDLTPDGARLATGDDDGRVKVWDVATGAEVARLDVGAPATSVRFNPDGKRLFTATGKAPARLWNVTTGATVRMYARDVRPQHVRVSADGRRIAAVGDGYGVWMSGTGDPAPSVETRWAYPDGVLLSQDGRRALVIGRAGGAILLDTDTGAELRAYARPPYPARWRGGGHFIPQPGMEFEFRVLRLLGDGRRVLDATRRRIVVRNTDTDEVLLTFGAGPEPEHPFVLSPDHGLLLTGDMDGGAHLWDVATGAFLRTLPGNGSRVLSCSLDAANDVVVTGSEDGSVVVWNARTGDSLGRIPTTVPGAHAVSLSPDRRYLLTWRRSQRFWGNDESIGPTAQLWDLRHATPIGATYSDDIAGGVWRADSAELYTGGRQSARRVVNARDPTTFAHLIERANTDVWVQPIAYEPASALRGGACLPAPRRDTEVGGRRLPFDGYHGLYPVAMSGDGSTFATIATHGSIDIWRSGERAR